jgi:hypothetical protein
MTNDELADALAPLIREAHERIDASGAVPMRIKRKAAFAHALLDEVLTFVKGEGIVSPMSGGDPKPEEGP